MDKSLDIYFERLEYIAFFSGFPLLYAVVFVLAGSSQNRAGIRARLVSSLSYAYATVGLLYWGYFIKSLYPDYSFRHILDSVHQPFLKIWALLSLLIWIPAINKRFVISLLHSLVFMYILCRDLIQQAFSPNGDRYVIRNDMKLYSDSLLLNTGVLLIVLLLAYLISGIKKPRKSRN